MSNTNKPESSDPSALRKTFYNEDDEIDLIDVVVQLWKGKVIIICSVVLAIIIAAVYLQFVQEKWSSRAIVTTPSSGQVANYNAALNALYSQYPQDKTAIYEVQRQLFGRFSSSLSALSASLQNIEEPLDLKVEPVVKGQSEPLQVSFIAKSAKEAQKQLEDYIQETNDDVIKDFSADIKHSLAVKQRELNLSLAFQEQVAEDKKQQRLDVIRQALKIAQASNITDSQLSQAEFLSDDTLYLLGSRALSAMIDNESTKPLDLDNAYYDTQRALLAINNLKLQVDNIQSYRYIMKPTLQIRRDSPKKSLTMVLAILLGGIIGSATVLGRNISRNYRARH